MRFLVGLISGAAVVMVAVEVLGGEAGWRDRLETLAADLGALVRPGHGPSDASLEPGSREIEALAVPPLEAADQAEPARDPIPRPPDPRPVDTSPGEDVQHIVAQIFGPVAGDAGEATADPAAPPVEAAGTSAEAAGTSAAAETDAVTPGSAASTAGTVAEASTPSVGAGLESDPAPPGELAQNVWVPFHSQMSASGFAERLSASLEYPFRVERRGPGRYQVVFAYRDEQQRQAVLHRAAEVTGLPL